MEPPVVRLEPGLDTDATAARLTAAGPLVRVALPGDLHVWALTHFDALREALRDQPHAFRRGARNWRALNDGEIGRDHPVVAFLIGSESMLTSDDPDHARERKLVQSAFTHRRVQLLRPRVEQVTAELLDAVERAGRAGPVDLKAEFAVPLPIRIICDLLGIDDADVPAIADITTRALSGLDATATRDADAFAAGMVEAKRARPDDNLISALIAARYEGDALTDRELVDNIILLFLAGFETTMGTLANGVRALLAHPDQLRLVRSGEVTWEATIEEILRWDNSVATLPMIYTARDITVGGVELPAGEPVLMAFKAANRDPAVWAEASAFDVTRPKRANLAFGHGVHRCLGEPLARLELNVALPAVFERFPDLAAVPGGDDSPAPTLMMNHPKTLLVDTGGR
ncbi:cytochrome P450 family protein [Streptomonospora litoralis]|uniref:Vitamin D(3) 25-hydroxylase n=1 Tax=Streptomonospora litoralis TaxID=2498135 RepID=A0A4P6Q4N4_9ACTN|nr:cytochrome P450 [Streptomonospora litoralis]QBI55553.1 Vitamin D(3) 25-hydroxylase [Streptomonospora litoralis]